MEPQRDRIATLQRAAEVLEQPSAGHFEGVGR